MHYSDNVLVIVNIFVVLVDALLLFYLFAKYGKGNWLSYLPSMRKVPSLRNCLRRSNSLVKMQPFVDLHSQTTSVAATLIQYPLAFFQSNLFE